MGTVILVLCIICVALLILTLINIEGLQSSLTFIDMKARHIEEKQEKVINLALEALLNKDNSKKTSNKLDERIKQEIDFRNRRQL